MAKNGVELELKDAEEMTGEKLRPPKTQRPNYESLKEHNDNNGKCSIKTQSFRTTKSSWNFGDRLRFR